MAENETYNNARLELVDVFQTILNVGRGEEEYKARIEPVVKKVNLDERTRNVIHADCQRSLHHWWGGDELKDRQECLERLITAVFCYNRKYVYYQGFHDIVATVYMAYEGSADRFYTIVEICSVILKDYLHYYALPDSKEMYNHLQLIRLFGNKLVPDKYKRIEKTQYALLAFAPTLFTLWLHRIEGRTECLRILRYVLTGGQWTPFYMCCAAMTIGDVGPDDPVELQEGNNMNQAMLSGIRFGYRPDEMTETEYVDKLLAESDTLAKTPVTDIVAQKRRHIKPATISLIVLGIAAAGAVSIGVLAALRRKPRL